MATDPFHGHYKKGWGWAKHRNWKLRSLADQKAYGKVNYLGGADWKIPAGVEIPSTITGTATYTGNGVSVHHALSGVNIVYLEPGKILVANGAKAHVSKPLVITGAKYLHTHAIYKGKRITYGNGVKIIRKANKAAAKRK